PRAGEVGIPVPTAETVGPLAAEARSVPAEAVQPGPAPIVRPESAEARLAAAPPAAPEAAAPKPAEPKAVRLIPADRASDQASDHEKQSAFHGCVLQVFLAAGVISVP